MSLGRVSLDDLPWCVWGIGSLEAFLAYGQFWPTKTVRKPSAGSLAWGSCNTYRWQRAFGGSFVKSEIRGLLCSISSELHWSPKWLTRELILPEKISVEIPWLRRSAQRRHGKASWVDGPRLASARFCISRGSKMHQTIRYGGNLPVLSYWQLR